ncbi:hypothetical protein [Roseomonas chloroacetimidivorans]|uniref:hypothetical protein n=1 Tax=Roseomonas chloroacetimidivorans TaxID=1766656 RepID=UPI003C7082C7
MKALALVCVAFLMVAGATFMTGRAIEDVVKQRGQWRFQQCLAIPKPENECRFLAGLAVREVP